MNLETMMHYKTQKMKTQNHNLFLLEDNYLSSIRIENFLESKFPDSLLISRYQTSGELLKAINSETTIVVLDYDLKGEKSELLLQKIKRINPNTEVIVMATDEDIAEAINAYKNGAKSVIIKGEKAPRQLFSVVFKILNYPVKLLVERFAINKILAIFIAYFLGIGIIVFLGMYFLP